MHALAGTIDCVSIICCVAVSSSCATSGRSPVPRPATHFRRISSYPVWLTRSTFTLVWLPLNLSTRPCSTVSFAWLRPCQNVIVTGPVALSSAATGHAPESAPPLDPVPPPLAEPPPPLLPLHAPRARAAAATKTTARRRR